MPAEALNHYTIQARDMEKTKDFYEQIVGLKVGDRPPLNFPGYWLYCCLLYTSPSPRDS